jgi:hypothetical protein
MLEFDVVIVGSNYIPGPGVGDVLADYAELGGGVVELVAMMHGTFGISGRWRSDGWSVFPVVSTTANGGSVTIYDDTHPIIDGPAGKVSTYGCTLCIGLTSITPGAILLADYNTGWKAAAYREEDERFPGSGRVVGLNIFAQEGYHSGDAYKVIANAAFWASQNEAAQKLSQPYQLPAAGHIYADDHPEHVTPSDQFQPRNPVIYDQNFDTGWGIYGDNPPTDWIIEDHATPPPVNWDYNDWHRYFFYSSYPGGTNTYAARVYYYPEEDQDEELITPSIDISGYSSVTLEYATYYNDMTTTTMDYGYVDVRFDGGSWTNVYTFSNSDDFGDMSHTITVPSGSDTMQVRWRYVAFSEYYWYVDNVEVTSGSDDLFDEDFNGAWGTYGNNPPSGWTILDHGTPRMPWDYNDWHRYMYYTSYPGPGTGTNAARAYYYPYEVGDEWLISPEFDLTTGSLSTANVQFLTYFYNPYPNNRAKMLYRLDGGAWTEIFSWSTTTSGQQTFDMTAAIGYKLQFAFNYLSPDANFQGYCYWYVENFHFEGIPELKHVYGMTPWLDSPIVTVANVMPTTIVPDDIASVVPEDRPITFEGIEIYDPALWEDTEEFWYRWDFDDGEVTPWIYKGTMTKMDVLLIHSLGTSGDTGADFGPIRDAILSNPFVTRLDTYNPFDTQDTPDLPELEQYGVIVLATNYANTLGWFAAAMEKLGDNLADYLDHNTGGFVSLMFTLDLSPYYGDLFGLPGSSRYVADDYGAFEPTLYPFTPGTLGTIYQPNHPVMQGVNDLSCLYVQSGDYPLTMGGGGMAAGRNGELLADWSTGNSAIGVKELSNGARSVNIGAFANAAGDYNRLISNAITWSVGGNIVDQFIEPTEHTFGDNGVYNVDIQVCDDDMNWVWTPGDDQPTYVGPAGEEDLWIAHNVMPTEVLNQDPVIAPRVRAYAELDLSIRMSGTKTHEATMTLYENGVDIGHTSVTRVPGSPNIGVISNVDLEMTKGFDYEIVIEVDPQGDGGSNPTWLFDMVFPDGKYKEFKFTFNDEHGWTQTITSSQLKGALLGHDIIFEASADDVGSDDLAFIWNFGDSTPYGVHLYSNEAQSSTGPDLRQG